MAPYLKVANDYADQLTTSEQAALQQYNAGLATAAAVSTAPAFDPAAGIGATGDPRERAQALVQGARAAMQSGDLGAARGMALQAQALQAPFAAEEDSPARLLSELDGMAPSMGRRGDKAEAIARLKLARQAIEAGDPDRAEAIAAEVESWDLNFGLLGESPKKVRAAATALRQSLASRNVPAARQPDPAMYQMIVAEARALVGQGRLDEAEARARQASAMGVVPPVTADRAENILQDVASIRAGGTAPAADSPSATAERAANGLLERGDIQGATAKFEEAARLRAQEQGTFDAPAITLADSAVSRTAGDGDGLDLDPLGMPAGPVADEPAPAPLDALPAFDPANAPPPAPSASPFDAMLADDPAPSPAAEPMAVPGADSMARAQALLSAGNFPAAMEAAEEAQAAGAGLEAENLVAQIDQTRQQAALQLYEAALDSLRKSDLDRTRALLRELASSDLDEAMAQRVQDLMMKVPAEGATGRAAVGFGSLDDAEAVKAQQLNAEVGTKVAEARRLMETDPAKAITTLEETLAAVKAAELPEAVARTMTRRVEVAIELAKKDKVAFDLKMKDKSYREEVERKRLRIMEAESAQLAKVGEFMEKAEEAQSKGDYLGMQKFAEAAVKIDPNNVAATAMAWKAKAQRHYEIAKATQAGQEETALNAWAAVDRAGVVDPEVIDRDISLGSGFEQLTKDRRAMALRLNGPTETAKEAEIRKALEQPITLPNSDRMTLGEAIRYIGEYTGVNIVPDHAAMIQEGVTLDQPVVLTSVKDVKLQTVLKLMLSQVNLSYAVRDDVLMITSPQANRKEMITKTYGVGDLVISPLNANKQAMQAPGSGFVSPPGMGMGGASGTLDEQAAAMDGNAPGMPSLPGMGEPQQTEFTRDHVDFEPLISLIKASIAPGTWANNGRSDYGMAAFGQGAGGGFGDVDADQGVGSITPFFLNISLIIRQTAEVHDEIVELLRQLRRLQDLQVSIEVRFISLSDSFFEQIGVDFDFSIQSDVFGKKSSFATINPAATPVTPGGANPAPYLINPARDHSLGRQPVTVGVSGPTNDINSPSFNPNLQIPFLQNTIGSALNVFNQTPNLAGTFGVSFLSDLEVYLFMQAIQGDVRSNLVQAPKVTSFNGAPASVLNTTQRNFVASLTPILGIGAAAFQPQVSSFPDGVQLFVTPVVSADRRYVRMSLSPIFTTFLGFDTFNVPVLVGGAGGLTGGGAATANGVLQLPTFSITSVQTTVTVPDGGTVLLGGVKRLREERREFGVPILAKTPLINRLFRNIGIGRTTDSLMLMVTPRIIILEEEEERLGIPALQNFTF